MPDGKLILIAGRSTKQGTGLNMGKDSPEYREAVSTLEMNREDMTRFGLQDGDTVKIKTLYGEATVQCRGGELPKGMAFIAYGPMSSKLMGGETHASGMPNSKGFEVELERVG
jgi:formylmethanofuran dehydrogenase subunit B/formylmethanofuran dehydrogenase subunit D